MLLNVMLLKCNKSFQIICNMNNDKAAYFWVKTFSEGQFPNYKLNKSIPLIFLLTKFKNCLIEVLR